MEANVIAYLVFISQPRQEKHSNPYLFFAYNILLSLPGSKDRLQPTEYESTPLCF